MSVTILIPARLNSSRLPNKVLLNIGGRSMIQRTIDSCSKFVYARIVVLADDQEIVNHLNGYNDVYLTPEANNGTERICSFLSNIDTDIILNVQADEPFVSAGDLKKIVDQIKKDPSNVVTLCRNLEPGELLDRNAVKILVNDNSSIMFTRSPLYGMSNYIYKHIGIYGFHKSVLKKISRLQQTKNSIAESLEQITWMDNGINIKCIKTNSSYISIDTPEDLKKAIEYSSLYETKR